MAEHPQRRVQVVEDNEVNQAVAVAILTPIVAMTAAVLEDRQRCLAAGMDDHIAKPVLLAELQVVLSRWLEGEVTTAHAGGPAAAMGPTWEVLDPNRLAELGMLEATQNGTVLIDSLVERLLARIPIDLADLRTALDQGDATGVTRITHRLKGAAATVGSSGMVGLCEHLEVLARAGVIPPAANLVSRLEQEFNRASTSTPRTPVPRSTPAASTGSGRRSSPPSTLRPRSS